MFTFKPENQNHDHTVDVFMPSVPSLKFSRKLNPSTYTLIL